MAKMMDDMQTMNIPGSSFTYSSVRPEKLLQASQYSLIDIIIDETGSTKDFADGLLKVLIKIIEGCKHNTRARNILVRVQAFNESVREIHGYMLSREIDTAQYKPFHPTGMTALYDAVFSGVGATLAEAKRLSSLDYDVNGAVYIVTDGCNNIPGATPSQIKELIDTAMQQEDVINSLEVVLIELNDPKSPWTKDVTAALKKFKDEAGITKHIDIGKATPENLAKMGDIVSDSISSVSSSLNGGSQTVSLKV